MINVNYVTGSVFKREEIKMIESRCQLSDGTPIQGNFSFELHELNIPERLEVDIEKMVRHEVKEAYTKLKVPCFVEHAGLIFDSYKDQKYPGGLTKPMWNTLGNLFISETNSSQIRVSARAYVGYCDGKEIHTFMGETVGTISSVPKGDRCFYWDTIFIPDGSPGLTYAEIVQKFGLEEKITKFSQSSKAIIKLLDFIKTRPNINFWE